MDTPKILRRYTDIPALIYLLSKRKISLLNSKMWDDKNDSYYLALYCKKKGLSSVLALCFSQVYETYHHWRVFAGGSAGVCICFKKEELLNDIRSHVEIKAREVKYMTLKGIKKSTPKVRDLPFLKRYAYENESEFRIIYESQADNLTNYDVPISIKCIDKIILSPWTTDEFAVPLMTVIKSITGCSNLNIIRSTLISNLQWKKHGEKAIT